MKYGSVCSGIEAASVALEPLGWTCTYVAEIEPFPCHVLNQRFSAGRPLFMPDPQANDIDDKERAKRRANARAVLELPVDTPLQNVGDFSRLDPSQYELPDVLIGGTPCQGFSLAGLRNPGDDRSNLALQFVSLAHATDALRQSRGDRGLVVVWENVPGVLSMPDNAFGCLLGGFVGAAEPLEIRGSWPGAGMVVGPRARAAWRVLDAQYFDLAQRRERVFLVVSFRDGPDPSAVLFERQSVQGHSPPSRESRQDLAGTLAPGSGGGCGPDDNDAVNGRLIPDIAGPLGSNTKGQGWRDDLETTGAYIPGTEVYLGNAEGGAEELPFLTVSNLAKTVGNQTPLVGNPIAFSANDYGNGAAEDVSPSLRSMGSSSSKQNAGQVMAIAFESRFARNGRGAPEDVVPPLKAESGQTGKGDSAPLVAIAFPHAQITSPTNRSNPQDGDPSPALSSGGQPMAVAFKPSHFTRGKDGAPSEVRPPLSADADKGDQDPLILAPTFAIQGAATRENPASGPDGVGVQEGVAYTLEARSEVQMVSTGWTVRRLTPTECERLQGFPDGWTQIRWRGSPSKDCPDGPRYRALGNAFPVPVIRWIGQRIEAVAACG